MKRTADEIMPAVLDAYGRLSLPDREAHGVKRMRGKSDVLEALWYPDEAAADLWAMARRMEEGRASDVDRAEMDRLARGSMWPPTLIARRDMRYPIARMYAALWESLGQAGADAVDATTGGQRPPTFVEVQNAYMGLDWPGSVEQHMNRLELAARGEFSFAYKELGEAVNRAARRALITTELGRGNYPYYPAPFSAGWEPVVRAAYPNNLDSCDDDIDYIIVVTDEEDKEGRRLMTHVALLKNEMNRSAGTMLTAVAVVNVEFDFDLLFDPDRAEHGEEEEPEREEVENIFSNIDATPFDYTKEQVTMFLSLLAHPDDMPPSAPYDPLPAGVTEIWRALVPLPSDYSLDYVESTLDVTLYPNKVRLDPSSTRALRLSECQLAVALRLFTGQVAARERLAERNRERGQRAVSLAEAAALAYSGPIGPDTLPVEVIETVGQTLWDTTCAAPALPDGRLFNADRLLDLAAMWGYQVDPAEAYRPELLCSTIDDMAIVDEDKDGGGGDDDKNNDNDQEADPGM
ncbi:hypothetical protein pqer_cds_188 [Pandoravirus quercus]|nr:hypothetical protein pqer_cds_188 [Pandoravirus quercus]AVK74610.1 hypothetical protein pqer_cds_188 [Pandoravirus quercus]